MATYSIAATGAVGHVTRLPNVQLVDVVIDFSSQTHAAADIFQALTIPADSMVLWAGIDVLTADTAGNSGTVALTSSAPSVTYVAAAAPTSTGAMDVSVSTADAGSLVFNYYNTSDTLDLTVATGAINAVVRIYALVVDCGGRNASDSQLVVFST